MEPCDLHDLGVVSRVALYSLHADPAQHLTTKAIGCTVDDLDSDISDGDDLDRHLPHGDDLDRDLSIEMT